MKRLIALSGRAGSGKNTVATTLGGHEISFAEPLKRFAQEVFDFTDAQMYGPSEERNRPDERWRREHGPLSNGGVCKCCGWRCVQDGIVIRRGDPAEPACYLTPRYALQSLGTEWGRGCFEDVWAKLGVRRALMFLNGENRPLDARDRLTGEGLVVITDCRFVNEARTVREAGGEVWRIVRPGAGLAGAAGLHPSEAEQESPEFLALVTRTIQNAGSIGDLRSGI